ncbi:MULTISPECIES: MurR/RpiR family transcriptional regulator [Clostridium]|jgi:DNA-binding MurR/RpiR family transcriptional regulator|uniref:RpiR family transcriptional regulator n=2 Tax=Clostridium TaxID=1485 RepID=A0A0B5Q925_CLOBE|nr:MULTISPECIES: MurR/RpiR family transcriptional regulator [Clostridium]AJG97465.2 RpiR family transcriptional regulator [Clostridium beijerinckii]MBN7575578.1 MurR/RpiR family transcriptional regulator [Clostridium beijerinckii]MBN7580889.1 MurR/RpiR family transcriptional regulator [Clostridium beijerinckii]MBN7585342.1 MurR/RpiR family transcriptional regulator [Clostridium beijerinckii]MBO0521086.1 MurR/RpiR family transcriptional regulator [Clostridium beijerinckii]
MIKGVIIKVREIEKSVLDKILCIYKSLHEAEKKIADYIINNKEKVIEMTVSELALESSVSEATIVRFCKKCDLKGFYDLKIKIAKEMVNLKSSNISNELDSNNIMQSLQNILANKIEELKQTISMMNEGNIKRILEAIKGARIVQFAAVGNTIPVAMDGAYKFNQLGISSVTNTIWETQLAFSYTLTKEDVVIVISNSGASKELVALLEIANERQATTISITNHENSPVANKSKYHINTSTREKLFLDEFSFSRVSAMVVIEILYLLLTRDKEDAYNWISQHEQSIAEGKI